MPCFSEAPDAGTEFPFSINNYHLTSARSAYNLKKISGENCQHNQCSGTDKCDAAHISVLLDIQTAVCVLSMTGKISHLLLLEHHITKSGVT